ncbi:hypothetical protein ROZALSC1DRAFT_30516 [Rozella allomycis CSF55]|uniref:AMMECR1 domain-containing protein n=1 Tax=Rozella allomycis (strain CSF55) TaxID=988480 RepID=A0A4P9YER1_ROZAC|nr:hypothetical protein ROZALSC1DRAFT_30516 [Rozella allomycis CSF55]
MTPDHCFYCFEILSNHLNGDSPPTEPQFENAKNAFNDSRFSPITMEEISHLSCAVSILDDFEDDLKWDNWDVGIHGIKINYKSHSATYLPEVAHNQGWTKYETIVSLLKKAGYYGHINDTVLDSLSLVRYKSCKHEAHYQEWVNSYQ